MSDTFNVKSAAVEALSKVMDPSRGKDIVELGMIEKIETEPGVVKVTVLFEDTVSTGDRHAVEDAIYEALEALSGIDEVGVLPVTRTGLERSKAAPKKKKSLRIHGGGGGGNGAGAKPEQAPPAAGRQASAGGQQKALEGVGQVIAVASGKGGVGKSTVAVNLALALHRLGHRVGLLDIDIYGPSLPTLLNVKGRPAVRERRIVPIEAAGLRLMSLGFLMEDDTPVIWRGPIVTGIIRQFLQDVDWTGTDYLIIDMPPGTGDAQLSLAQTVPVDGAIVVTTPSDLALIDAARGLQMFRTLDVEVLGMVENMSYQLWPGIEDANKLIGEIRNGADEELAGKLDALQKVLDENRRLHIFGHGGGKREAERLEIPLLGEIPLDGNVREGGDTGEPIVIRDPDGPVTQAFLDLAKRVTDAKPLGAGNARGGVFSFMRS